MIALKIFCAGFIIWLGAVPLVASASSGTVTATPFGILPDGRTVELYRLHNDHNWVISNPSSELMVQAEVYEAETGRLLEVLSAQPGIQFYSGNFLDGSNVGKGGWKYERYDGFCAEPQHFPDSPNKPEFPSTVLKPGQTYKNTIVCRVKTRQ